MKITLNKSDVGLLSIITEQVQTNLFKFRLSTTVVEGTHYLQEELPKAWGIILCINGTWSFIMENNLGGILIYKRKWLFPAGKGKGHY